MESQGIFCHRTSRLYASSESAAFLLILSACLHLHSIASYTTPTCPPISKISSTMFSIGIPTVYGATATTTFTATATGMPNEILTLFFPTLTTVQPISYTTPPAPTNPSSKQFPGGLPVLILTEVDGVIVNSLNHSSTISTATIVQAPPPTDVPSSDPLGGKITLIPPTYGWDTWGSGQRAGVVVAGLVGAIGLFVAGWWVWRTKRKARQVSRDMENGPFAGEGGRPRSRSSSRSGRRKRKDKTRQQVGKEVQEGGVIEGLANVELGPAARSVLESVRADAGANTNASGQLVRSRGRSVERRDGADGAGITTGETRSRNGGALTRTGSEMVSRSQPGSAQESEGGNQNDGEELTRTGRRATHDYRVASGGASRSRATQGRSSGSKDTIDRRNKKNKQIILASNVTRRARQLNPRPGTARMAPSESTARLHQQITQPGPSFDDSRGAERVWARPHNALADDDDDDVDDDLDAANNDLVSSRHVSLVVDACKRADGSRSTD